MKFEIKEQFYLNDQPFKIISGSIHYFRVMKDAWEDRLIKLKAMGCNTVETYVPWNLHERNKGDFNFKGNLDIAHFIELAQKIGLYVIVRPSPYICAEWEFGGLPGWLLKDPAMKVRTTYPPFIQNVSDYYKVLFNYLSPLQIDKGGPIILMQIENEYGYYGNDKAYLKTLMRLMRENGVTVPLVTSDGPWGEALEAGSLSPELALPTLNFGSQAKEHFENFQKKYPNLPVMCMEFWIGWFDAWGEKEHHRRNADEVSQELKAILEKGSVNFYMFFGGTNFGFMNGTNHLEEFKPDVTSYDYDAILTEWGEVTEKYHQCKAVIKQFVDVEEIELLPEIPKINYGTFKLSERVSLFNTLETLAKPIENSYPLPMEALDQNYGYILYRSDLGKARDIERVMLLDAADRAQVFINYDPVITQYEKEIGQPFKLSLTKENNNQVDILIENMGRANFGPRLLDQRKGIKGGFIVDSHAQSNWEHFNLSLENIDQVDYKKGYQENQPSFSKFLVKIEKIGDTFIDMKGFGKGVVFVNGFNIGRYWEIGPQTKLYIPSSLLKEGNNEIVVFETEGKVSDEITLSDQPGLGD